MAKQSNFDILEEAKTLMEWEGVYREPTLLEYLRYYKSDIIKELHILAAVAVHAPVHYIPRRGSGVANPAHTKLPQSGKDKS